MPEDKKLPEQNIEQKSMREQAVKRPTVREQVEKIIRPEKEKIAEGASEQQPEKEGLSAKEKIGEAKGAGDIIAAGRQAQKLKRREKEIEKAMEKDLIDMYINMPPDKQREFKAVGERTAKEINKILSSAKVKVKKIIDLIKKWLSIIPGVNKFFLEQEAKLKTDEILKIKK